MSPSLGKNSSENKDLILVSFDVVFVYFPASLAVVVTRNNQLQDQTLEDRPAMDVDDIVMLCAKKI